MRSENVFLRLPSCLGSSVYERELLLGDTSQMGKVPWLLTCVFWPRCDNGSLSCWVLTKHQLLICKNFKNHREIFFLIHIYIACWSDWGIVWPFQRRREQTFIPSRCGTSSRPKKWPHASLAGYLQEPRWLSGRHWSSPWRGWGPSRDAPCNSLPALQAAQFPLLSNRYCLYSFRERPCKTCLFFFFEFPESCKLCELSFCLHQEVFQSGRTRTPNEQYIHHLKHLPFLCSETSKVLPAVLKHPV